MSGISLVIATTVSGDSLMAHLIHRGNSQTPQQKKLAPQGFIDLRSKLWLKAHHPCIVAIHESIMFPFLLQKVPVKFPVPCCQQCHTNAIIKMPWLKQVWLAGASPFQVHLHAHEDGMKPRNSKVVQCFAWVAIFCLTYPLKMRRDYAPKCLGTRMTS